jgi:hypothetical protein
MNQQNVLELANSDEVSQEAFARNKFEFLCQGQLPECVVCKLPAFLRKRTRSKTGQGIKTMQDAYRI